MFVKQIGTEEALKLAVKGREVLVMVPRFFDDGNGWTDYDTHTLAGMLEGCMFFRKELAMEVWDGLDEGRVVNPVSQEGETVTLEEQIQHLPPAEKNCQPDVWIPARLTEKEKRVEDEKNGQQDE